MSKLGDVIEIDGVRYKSVLSMAYIFTGELGMCDGCDLDIECEIQGNNSQFSCADYTAGIDFIWVRYDEDQISFKHCRCPNTEAAVLWNSFPSRQRDAVW